ncbi:MAG: thiamine-phosphate pyrophosphorylase [Candidatus Omnitrophica bacterium]|nr:thiamine-phosphate pyrophosphorylase [Candidatus Omnitrophota bacterium]
MSKNSLNIESIYRIIDVNINRTQEGLRVCEEIARFVLNSLYFTKKIKGLRHNLKTLVKRLPFEELLKARDTLSDIGKITFKSESKRKNWQEIFSANIQRVKESLRVLEEFSKLINSKISIRFKELRYRIYELEKRITPKI